MLWFVVASAKNAPPDSVSRDDTARVPIHFVLGPRITATEALGPCMDAELADLDGNGTLDVALAVEFFDNVVLWNDGSAVFTAETLNAPSPGGGATGNDSEEAAAFDVDADGGLDLLFVSEDLGGDGGIRIAPHSGARMVGSVAFVSLVVGVAHAGPTPLLEWVWTVDGDQEDEWLGSAVAGAGDVNGDGFADVLVAAHRYNDVGGNDEGRVDLYLGTKVGPEKTAAWTMIGDQEWGNFGASVASAGDVNGDGFADVIIGATLYDDGESDEGIAYLYLGSSSGLETTASWTADGDNNLAGFGKSVASAGDVNGDGFDDVIVGANLYDVWEDSEGTAFVYHGSKDGLSKVHVWSSAGTEQPYAQFGVSVASAGDVNGDGFADVIVGCLNYENGSDEEGGAFVFLGSPSGLETKASWIAESDQDYAQFGISVASAGDVNGDGYDDVIVGAAAYDDTETDQGAAFLYFGSPTGLLMPGALASFMIVPEALGNVGMSVASAGDVNSDGFDDVLIGAPYYNGATFSDGGLAQMVLGSASGLSITTWTLMSSLDNESYGSSVSSARDVNGDGVPDVIIGANQHDSPPQNAGRAFVALGSGSGKAHGGGDDGGGDDGTGDDGTGDDGGGDDGTGDDSGVDDSGAGDDGSDDDDDPGCGCGGAPGGSLFAAMLALVALSRRYRPAP